MDIRGFLFVFRVFVSVGADSAPSSVRPCQADLFSVLALRFGLGLVFVSEAIETCWQTYADASLNSWTGSIDFNFCASYISDLRLRVRLANGNAKYNMIFSGLTSTQLASSAFRRALSLCAVAILAGCSNSCAEEIDTPPLGSNCENFEELIRDFESDYARLTTNQLLDAYEAWRKKGYPNYRYEWQSSCEACEPRFEFGLRITVSEGNVVAVELSSVGEAANTLDSEKAAKALKSAQTITQLFDMLLFGIEKDIHVWAEFDAQNGRLIEAKLFDPRLCGVVSRKITEFNPGVTS